MGSDFWRFCGDTTTRSISIHAPRVGSDRAISKALNQSWEISIHAPRVGSDWKRYCRNQVKRWHFNPRSPCGERRCAMSLQSRHAVFQSTLPVWGATTTLSPLRLDFAVFQSTLPVWGATLKAVKSSIPPISISIHAPRVGSDLISPIGLPYPDNFNPRSPCGERLLMFIPLFTQYKFQSTLPVWGATKRNRIVSIVYFISIHAPRVGSDQSVHAVTRIGSDISIHAPRVGSDHIGKKLPI